MLGAGAGSKGGSSIHLGTAPPRHCPPPTPAPAPRFLQVLLPASLWAASVPAHVGHPCTGFSRVTSHPKHLGPARLGSAQAHERAARPYAGARTPQVLAPTLPPRDYGQARALKNARPSQAGVAKVPGRARHPDGSWAGHGPPSNLGQWREPITGQPVPLFQWSACC